MLEAISFVYLPILQNWWWMEFLSISLPTYLNLVRAFFSNAKLKHDESGDTVIVITSVLMGTPTRLTLEELGDYLHLPSEGSFDEKGHFDPSLFIQFGSTSELNLHDPVLLLILTWNLRPIKKSPDLAFTLCNDIMKAIGRGMNTIITLPY
ncbi:hypothetical protein Golob_005619, partial [Gossypium lobatum]|nr:hypothetical protein [Gossypium lobatum]